MTKALNKIRVAGHSAIVALVAWETYQQRDFEWRNCIVWRRCKTAGAVHL